MAVPGEVALLLSVWLINDPDELLPPEIPVPLAAVQLHAFVPPVVLLESAILGPVAVQIVGFDGVAVAAGKGLTVTVCVIVEPEQLVLLRVNTGVIT